MRDLTRELGIILIFDEVQSARVSPGGAQELLGVVPGHDGAGQRRSAVARRPAPSAAVETSCLSSIRGAEIRSCCTPAPSNANPVTMAAGEATLSRLTPSVYERLCAGRRVAPRQAASRSSSELEISNQVTGIASLFGAALHGRTRSSTIGRHWTSTASYREDSPVGLMNEGVFPRQLGQCVDGRR